MTETTKRRRTGATRGFTLAAFALLALCLPGAASAQWAPSSNGAANINNTNTGNVGVGTPSPYLKLTVGDPARYDGGVAIEGNDNATNILFNTGGANRGRVTTLANGLHLQSYSGGWVRNDLFIRDDGNVGVGTAAPSARLTVTDGSAPYAAASTDLMQLKRGTANGTADGGVSIVFGNSTNGFRLKYGGTSDRFGFIDGGNGEVLSLVNGGNVGIGTTAPAAKLDVNGDIRVSGNINAKYQDVAEWVPSTQKLSAGTVVTLDPERANQVLASTSSYDTAVAGVISAQPGISLGEAGEGKVLVATTGRVKVRVDATKAPVRIGDLLVTSEVEGVAMRSEPVAMNGRKFHSPGTIIGKALEPLASGTGEILVLLSLQ